MNPTRTPVRDNSMQLVPYVERSVVVVYTPPKGSLMDNIVASSVKFDALLKRVLSSTASPAAVEHAFVKKAVAKRPLADMDID